MQYTLISDKTKIDDLLGKESRHGNFVYQYDADTITLLKRNFSLPDSLYIWVTNDDEFVGFVSCDRDWWEDGCFFLREIFVDPAFQGHGLGKSLVSRCIDHAEGKGALTLVTQTAFENIPMQKLCESLDFQRWENPQWDDGITYKLFLK